MQKTIRSIVSLLTVLLLLFSAIPLSIKAEEIEGIINQNDVKAIVLGETSSDTVALYKEESKESDVLAKVPDNTEITVLKSGENFSNIQYINDKTNETLEGFIENTYLVDPLLVDQFLEDRNSKQVNENENDNIANSEQNSSKNEETTTNKIVTKETNEQESSNTSIIKESTKNNAVDENSSEEVNQPKEQMKKASTFSTKSNSTVSTSSIQGIALKSPTNVYLNASTSSKVLKSYSQGSKLKYRSYNSAWYECTIYVNGKAVTGYISKSDVENTVSSPQALSGIALKNPVVIYSLASTNSKSLKTYGQGTILKYKTYTSNWYICTVYINGKATTGYINKSDVDNIVANPSTLNGVGLFNPTKVYSKASTTSTVLKTYAQGTVLKYTTFTSGWFSATVYINGKATTGYIKKSDVENSFTNQQTIRGIGLKSPTKVYSGAGTNLKVLKSYAQGTILTFKTFTNNWYECKVYINGQAKTGYISKNDVEKLITNQKTINGMGIKSPTKIYSKASTSSKVLKTYSIYTPLKYKTFTTNWFECTIYINGVKTTGYINKNDVRVGPITTNSKYNISLNEMVSIQSKANPQTDLYRNEKAYVSKEYIKLKGSTFPTKGEVLADKLNVREGPGTNYWTYGQLTKQNTVDVTGVSGNWYIIQYNSFRNAKPEDVAYYVTPSNFKANTPEYFQFLLLNKTANITASNVNNKILINKGSLSGKGAAFINASKKYNINEIYLISHSLLETGNGTSQLARGVSIHGKTVYNVFGYGAFDGCAKDCGAEFAYQQKWFSIDAAIEGAAKLIGANYIHKGQDTLFKMRWNPANPGTHQYATDIGWAVKQVTNINKLYSLLDQYTLYFDYPVYK